MIELPFTAAPPRRYHPKRRPPAPQPPTLVAAEHDVGATLTLTFDRAVDAAAFDVASVTVNDGDAADFVFRGVDAPQQPSPTVVVVALAGVQDDAPPGVWMTVPADNGLVSVDDGAAWAGVTELALPFGE